jgi:hypothetical protein
MEVPERLVAVTARWLTDQSAAGVASS